MTAQKPLFQMMTIRCYKCHELVRLMFTYVVGRNEDWWEAKCTHCGTANFIHKPARAKDATHPRT